MYQMERNKLSEKYRVKDELIRSLSTQLQVNKVSATRRVKANSKIKVK